MLSKVGTRYDKAVGVSYGSFCYRLLRQFSCG